MKKEYNTPFAYVELFTPNQYAGNCQPGIPEDGLEPITQQCYFHDHSGSSLAYNLTSKQTCRASNNSKYNGNGSCSNLDATKSCITTKASCDVKYDSASTGLVTVQMSLDGGAVQPVYVWSNMKSGYHKMPTTMLPNNPTDSEGRPYYFNS